MKKHSGTFLWPPCFILSKEIQIKEKHLSEFVLVFDGMFKDVDMRDVRGMGGSSRLFFFSVFWLSPGNMKHCLSIMGIQASIMPKRHKNFCLCLQLCILKDLKKVKIQVSHL